jgi:hypothetical protein
VTLPEACSGSTSASAIAHLFKASSKLLELDTERAARAYHGVDLLRVSSPGD